MLENLIDTLINSMEDFEYPTNFVHDMKRIGVNLSDDILLDIFEKYWNVSARDRFDWDIPEWSQWLRINFNLNENEVFTVETDVRINENIILEKGDKIQVLKENSNRNIDDYFDRLKRRHPRSSYRLNFQNKINDLLNGTIDYVKRSEFRLSKGDQWGFDFVDELIDDKILKLKKQGRTQIITSYSSEDSISDKIKDIKKQLDIEIGIDNVGSIGKYDDLRMAIDTNKSQVQVICYTFIIDREHWEKGHYADQLDPKKELEKEIKKIENHYWVSTIRTLFKEKFNNFDYNIEVEKLSERYALKIAGHLGIPYKITFTFSK